MSSRRTGWALAIAALVLLEAAALGLWQRNAYVNFSDGVYALTAREWIHGRALYGQVAGAQPPPVFLLGALLLRVGDDIGTLRGGLGLLDAITAALAGLWAWRLDGRPWVGALAAFVTPLLPISLYGHAQLLPETIGAPLLLAGAGLAARERSGPLAGVLLALAGWTKVAFLLPALVVALLAPRRGRVATVGSLAGTSVLLYGGSALLIGPVFWRETVTAQFQVGDASLHYVLGLLVQSVWSELPALVGLAGFGWLWWRGRLTPRDPALARCLIGLALAGLALGLTVIKLGSYLDVLEVADPALAVLGVTALAGLGRPARSRVWALAGLAVLLLAAESVALLLAPTHPGLSTRPGAASGPAWVAGPAGVDREVAALRSCPAGAPVGAAPELAFLAGRGVPGAQPDLFMLAHAPADGAFARRAAGAAAVCRR